MIVLVSRKPKSEEFEIHDLFLPLYLSFKILK